MKKNLVFTISLLMLVANLFVQCEKDEVELWGTGSMTDPRDGKSYKTVFINGREWMAENLAYKAGSGCWAYNNDEDNVATFGYLYNWETAMASCPPGWHLATDDEWKQLEMAIGMSQSEADDMYMRGTNEGSKLKSTSGWDNDGNGSDDYGFSALPGGWCEDDGDSSGLGGWGAWWTATELGSGYAWVRGIGYYGTEIDRMDIRKRYGHSVRCVRD